MSEELFIAPCPFCGTTPSPSDYAESTTAAAGSVCEYADDRFDLLPTFWVKCRNKECEALGPVAPTATEAVEKWNQRIQKGGRE